MSLPERRYYPLSKAAAKLSCGIDDLLHYASIGVLQLCVYVNLDERNAPVAATLVSDWSDDLRESVYSGFIDSLTYTTNIIRVIESSASFTSEQKTKLTLLSGWLAIDQDNINDPSFEIFGELTTNKLLLPREKSSTPLATNGYNPIALLFNQPITLTINDFYILSNEILIIEDGGKPLVLDTLNAKMNSYLIRESDVAKKTLNSQAKLIKALLYLNYKDTDLLNNPRGHFDNEESEIRKDFELLGLTLPGGKTISKWIKDVDLDID